MADPRCARQRLLAEVGVEGQQRLGESLAQVPSGAGADIAVSYLERAGVPNVRIVGTAAAPFPHEPHLRYAAPRAVAFGAWSALCHVRRVLGIR